MSPAAMKCQAGISLCSVVESSIAARTMAAYIGLKSVRAGMVVDPAKYRWSCYGEAVGGGVKGNGKKTREASVRACMSHIGAGFEAEKWQEVSRVYRRAMGLALGRKSGKAEVNEKGRSSTAATAEKALAAKDNGTLLPDLGMAAMLLHRMRYFTDGAVIGSKAFVNEAFAAARERFGPRRQDGARTLRGSGGAPRACCGARVICVWACKPINRAIRTPSPVRLQLLCRNPPRTAVWFRI